MPKAEDVFLRIEAGMHTADQAHLAHRRRAAAGDGSDDKTVRLWSLPDGKLVRTLRPPIGPGDDGKVYAVALAPDGSWVAAGGWDMACAEAEARVYIFDAATGAMITPARPAAEVDP